MIDGIINVYKEKGFTSHDVVAKLRGILGQKKIGHTGTLDPDAAGVLPVCLGKGTKLCDMLTEQGKTYKAVLLLGIETDTQDMSGKIISRQTVNICEETIKAAVMDFIGDYEQIPPMYSALKVGGKKLCDLARAGIEVERKPRSVRIYQIDIGAVEYSGDGLVRAVLQVDCSKGTYIRTLCHDIGRKLGCGGCMESLVRTKAAGFRIEDALTLSEIETLFKAGDLMKKIVPVERVFESYPAVYVEKAFDKLVKNGNPFSWHMVSGTEGCLVDRGKVRVYDGDNRFIGIYEYEGIKREFKTVKMFL